MGLPVSQGKPTMGVINLSVLCKAFAFLKTCARVRVCGGGRKRNLTQFCLGTLADTVKNYRN